MAVRLNKIYTRRGDDGTTGLVGGERVSKGSLQLEAYGTVDELNSFLGLIRSRALTLHENVKEVSMETKEVFSILQNELFDIGSILATPDGKQFEGMAQVTAKQVRYLEERMDHYQEVLEPLESFVLPGSGVLNSHAHVARTVCRRLERILVRLNDQSPVDELLMAYVNRLSDYLFVYSRWVSKKCGEEEFLWRSQ